MSILDKFKIKKDKTQINADQTQTNADTAGTKVKSPRKSASSTPSSEISPVTRGQRKSVFRERQSAMILKQVWLTEKANSMSRDRKHIFIVDGKANKPEIKMAVENDYGVKVRDVNIIVREGKAKRLGRSVGRTSAFKKAIVTLKEGEKIEVV